MDPVATRPMPYIRHLLFAAVGVTFTWMLLTLVMGFGSSDARADQSDDGGAISGLTSLVDQTTDAVTDAATATTVAVADVAAAVVPAPPVAPPPTVAPVVQTVATTVQTVTPTVTAVITPVAVTPIVQPVVDVVTTVPVAGDVASGLGLDRALPAIAADVDETLGGITLPIIDTIDGVIPVLPDVELPPAVLEPSTVTVHPAHVAVVPPAVETVVPVSRHTTGESGAWSAVRTLAVGATAMATLTFSPLLEPGSGGLPLPFGAALAADLFSMGSSGAGPGVWGMLALAFFVAYRAWMLRKTVEDDDAPAAPLLGTDVSPD